ncbi:MAG: hypothetical protein CAF42_015375 [Nitrospira sp. CG24B]|jgi:hypothetical protein|nr:MAG: hypothetical protein CAF42_015375 [Nitrospira sp. CG24B]
MPQIRTQSDFQRLSKPNFCYMCGVDLNNGEIVNGDHCPPEKLFQPSDRVDYPIKVKVHARCNHKWSEDDEKLSIFFDILHGGTKANDPELLKKLSFLSVITAQGVYKGITCFPLRPLARRLIRCAHALLYGEYLPRETRYHIHYPIPEIDPTKGNEPFPNLLQTYSFANELCSAQKAETFDSLIAYNRKFRYVCTWSHLDNGDPICIFAFDIYRLANFAVKIEDFPRAVIGFYSVLQIPSAATRCTKLQVENSDEEVLYPILSC